MITFLSSPKPFTGAARDNQLNAVRSWLKACPGAEVILYGASEGCAEACAALGVKHAPGIACSPSGVPYFDAIARHAQEHARCDTQIYLNCDILIGPGIADALKAVGFPKFLILGQRIDLPPGAKLSSGDDLLASLRALAPTGAALHSVTGMDYFIFPRGLWEGLKPLVIGRALYDSALIGFCLRRGIPVIDATCTIMALHQHHDYSHLKDGEKEVAAGPDAKNNVLVHGVAHSPPNVGDAGWRLIDGRLLKSDFRGDLLRRFEIYLRYRRNMLLASYLVRAVWRALNGLGLYGPRRLELSDVIEHYG